jgi:hypothetical protein
MLLCCCNTWLYIHHGESMRTCVGWGDTAVMLLLAITLDFDVNAWMAPDERVNACDLPNMFHPLQFRKGTVSTPRKLLLRFVTGNHFVLLKPNPPNAVVRPGQAANEHHYFNGTRDVATGLCASSPHFCYTLATNNIDNSM